MGSLIRSLYLMASRTHSAPTATGNANTPGGICSFQTAMAVGVRYTLTAQVFGMSLA